MVSRLEGLQRQMDIVIAMQVQAARQEFYNHMINTMSNYVSGGALVCLSCGSSAASSSSSSAAPAVNASGGAPLDMCPLSSTAPSTWKNRPPPCYPVAPSCKAHQIEVARAKRARIDRTIHLDETQPPVGEAHQAEVHQAEVHQAEVHQAEVHQAEVHQAGIAEVHQAGISLQVHQAEAEVHHAEVHHAGAIAGEATAHVETLPDETPRPWTPLPNVVIDVSDLAPDSQLPEPEDVGVPEPEDYDYEGNFVHVPLHELQHDGQLPRDSHLDFLD